MKIKRSLISFILSLVMMLQIMPAFSLSFTAEGSQKEETAKTTDPIRESVTSKSDEDCVYVELPPVTLEEPNSFDAAATIASLDKNGKVQLKPGNYEKYIDRVDIPDYAMELYKTLEEGADGDGVADILIDVTKAEKNGDRYVIFLTKIEGTFSDDEDRKTVTNANLNEASAYVYASTAAFDRDHPEVFWLSGNWRMVGPYTYSEKGTYSQNIYLVLQETKDGSVTSDVRRAEYTNPTTLSNAIKERDRLVQAILANMPASAVTDDAKMRYFNEWLTHNNEYNTAVSKGQSASAWEMAWECICALQGNTGAKGPVCEGYSRAFQVLCMASGIHCVLVSGETEDINTGKKNGHMWNYVLLDGSWYGVDVTWNDPVGGKSGKLSGYERENYLFVGADTVAVKGEPAFYIEHPVENNVSTNGVRFTNGPVLSKTAYDSSHKHTFGKPTFRWNADGKGATAVFTCTESSSHRVEIAAAITSTVKSAANCEEKGTTSYTATATLDGVSYTDTNDVQDIPALGHDWGEWTVTKEPDETGDGERTRVCKRDPSHVETRAIVSGLLGDVNGDGIVNGMDRSALAQYVAKWNVDIDLSVADLNDDGKITAADRNTLARYVAKWAGYETLPVES